MKLSDTRKLYLETVNAKKNRKHKGVFRRIIAFFIFLCLCITISSSIYFYYQFNKINIKKICKTDEALGINTDMAQDITSNATNAADAAPNEPPTYEKMNDSIINIALLGTDRRSKNEAARSDAILIATLDFKHKDFKLSSIMRDSYVKIHKHGYNKITHAYVYGGPQLTLNTINRNFHLNIRDYVAVDFFNLEKIIDILGGVTINVNKYEVSSLNKNLAEQARLKNSRYVKIKKPGLQRLNGDAALAYSRIRSVGNGDYERTLRQRKVLEQLFINISNAGPSKYANIVSQLFPLVETSMSKIDILKYGYNFLYADIRSVKQVRFPVNNNFTEKRINGMDFIVPDMEKTRAQMHGFIFQDILPEK